MNTSLNNHLMKRFQESIPKLKKDLHKGQNGRIGIVGGKIMIIEK
jgi:NAD(P)H-hydrate repair Nnr-like enzyme with NAD(P)H-hydrate dehydratase domain